MNSLFTPDQIQDLREEFIEFEINEMSREEMASFIRNQKLKEYNLYDEDMLRPVSYTHLTLPTKRIV